VYIVPMGIRHSIGAGAVTQGLSHTRMPSVVPQGGLQRLIVFVIPTGIRHSHFTGIVKTTSGYSRASLRAAFMISRVVTTKGMWYTELPAVVPQIVSHTQLAGVVTRTKYHTSLVTALSVVVPKGQRHGSWMMDRCHVAQKDRNVPGTIVQSLANSGIQLLLMSVSQDLSEGQHQSVSQD